MLQGKISEEDIAECRAAFEELDETKNGKLTVEDLELITQRNAPRPQPRRRRLKRIRKAATSAMAFSIRERAEMLFPQWRAGRAAEPDREDGDENSPDSGPRRHGDLSLIFTSGHPLDSYSATAHPHPHGHGTGCRVRDVRSESHPLGSYLTDQSQAGGWASVRFPQGPCPWERASRPPGAFQVEGTVCR